jgi:hypothetical protein
LHLQQIVLWVFDECFLGMAHFEMEKSHLQSFRIPIHFIFSKIISWCVAEFLLSDQSSCSLDLSITFRRANWIPTAWKPR